MCRLIKNPEKSEMIINPKNQSVKENYKLMTGCIVPRPIAFVSTISKDGIPNLAPYSFFTGVSSKPPAVCISAGRKGMKGSKKDTLKNIEESGEFVVNTVSYNITEKMVAASAEFPAEINEFKEAGLTEAACRMVKAPRVKESLISMECSLIKIVEVGPPAAGGSSLVIGEIVLFHVADEIYKDGRIDILKLNPVGRLAGIEYTLLQDIFEAELKIKK